MICEEKRIQLLYLDVTVFDHIFIIRKPAISRSTEVKREISSFRGADRELRYVMGSTSNPGIRKREIP